MGQKYTEEELNRIEIREGWHWPFKDRSCWPWLQNEKDLPQKISQLCLKRRTIIQAGGNTGFYTKQYSEIFNRVVVFEPDKLNFQCLTMNVTSNNVTKVQTCIGDNRNSVALLSNGKNIGAYRVSDEPGLVPTLLIDDFNIQDCDLIHLDIEGFELFALKGAEETIKRCSPLIVVEWMNHGEKYGAPDIAIEEYLNSLGYMFKEMIYHDRVFIKG